MKRIAGLIALAIAAALVLRGDPTGRVSNEPIRSRSGDPPFPTWVFSHVVWENESTTRGTYELVDGYLERGVPVGAVIIDSPWETHYNTLEFDPDRYPNAKQLIADLRQKGIRTLLWITPFINLDDPEYEKARDRGFLVPGKERVAWWKGTGGLIDYANQEAVSWWHKRLDRALALGIDGWKADFADAYILKTGWKGWKRILPANRRAHADYARAYYSDLFQYSREKTGRQMVVMARAVEQTLNERNFGLPVWTNPTGLGINTQFAPVNVSFMSWVGDQVATFDGLRIALRNVLRSASRGYLIVGSDIGAFNDANRTEDLFLRWTQFGALCPLMENGGKGEHRPWEYGEEALGIYRFYALLHEALGPYLEQEAVQAWREGRSLITPLEDGRDQYLLGDDILVAPILSPGGERKVRFPAGSDWWSLFAGGQVGKGRIHTGGSRLVRTYSLAEFPVFLRVGSSIPLKTSAASRVFPGVPEIQDEHVLMRIPSESGAGGPRFEKLPTDRPISSEAS